MKIRPVEPNCSMRADGRMDGPPTSQPASQTDRQTDMTKLIDACRNFANAPKHSTLSSFICSPVTLSLCLPRYSPQHRFLKKINLWASLKLKARLLQNSWRNYLYDLCGKIGGVIQFLNWIMKNIWWRYPNLVTRVISIWYHCCQIAYVQTPWYLVTDFMRCNTLHACSFAWLLNVDPTPQIDIFRNRSRLPKENVQLE